MPVAGQNMFTIGHSAHELATFLRLLARHGLTAIAEVRRDLLNAPA